MTSGDVYTHGHQDAVLRSHRWRTAANSAAYLTPHLRGGLSLLDVGCGPGTLTLDLAQIVSPGRVVGVDVSAEVIAEAQERGGGADSPVDFVAGDFRTADLGDGRFDVVHAHQVLQHLSDPVGAPAAMAQLARPGGIVAARDSDYSAFTWWPADERLDAWRRVYLAVARSNRAEPDAGRWLLHWAHEAGLANVTYTTSTWTHATPDDLSWWCDLWAERCVASSFATQAVEYGIASRDELEDIAGGWREWATRDDAVFVVLHGEILAKI